MRVSLRLCKTSDSEFIETVRTSFSIRDVLNKLNLVNGGGSYKWFRIRCERLGVDTSHFTGMGHLKGKRHKWGNKIPLEELLVENSGYEYAHRIKKRLIDNGLKEHKCEVCGIEQWCDKPISLELHHLNGKHTDNRIENLQVICPNCHSQTHNYKGKNIKKKDYQPRYNGNVLVMLKKCLECNKELKDSRYKLCRLCYNSNREKYQTKSNYKSKIQWLPLDELIVLVGKTNYTEVGKMLGVSRTAVRAHIKKLQTKKLQAKKLLDEIL